MGTSLRTWSIALVVACVGYGCSREKPCRPGTVLLAFEVPTSVGLPVTLDVSVTVGGTTKASTVTVAKRNPLVEVDFPSGYPLNQIVSFKVTTPGDQIVLLESSGELQPGCTVISQATPSLDGGGDLATSADLVGSDLGMSDLGEGDLAVTEPDLLPPRVLSLVAGKLGGAGNLDSIGSQAGLSSVSAIVFDGADTLYVTDTENHAIRKVLLSNMAVITVAGSGAQAGSNDGIGEAARFNRPAGIAIAGDSLYVTDTDNHTIRRIVIATGEVTTLAGLAEMSGSSDGSGTAARFKNPRGLVADGSSTLYVCDTGNATIRKVTIGTKTVELYAGSTGMLGATPGMGSAARFNKPQAIASDAAGNLFVADGNHTIRKIVKLTADVSTLAGTAGMAESTNDTGAAARFDNPTSLAADASGNLYVSDTNNLEIRQIAISSGVTTTFAGAADTSGTDDGNLTAARFRFPGGVGFGPAGQLFIGDASVLRKASGGAVSTVAGAYENQDSVDGVGAAARFNSVGPGAVDSGGVLYLTDSLAKTIRVVNLTTADTTTKQFQFQRHPTGIAVDDTYIYVSDPINYVITRVSKTTTDQSDLAGEPGLMGFFDGTGAEARFKNPRSLYRSGTWIYLSDNNTVRRVSTTDGKTETIAGSAGMSGSLDGNGTAARFGVIGGITGDGSDTLYLTDNTNNTIRKVTISSKDVETIAGVALNVGYQDGVGAAASFDHPNGIEFLSGTLFIADTSNGTTRRMDVATKTVTTDVGIKRVYRVKLGPLPTTLNLPTLIFHFGSRLMIGDDGERSLLAVD